WRDHYRTTGNGQSVVIAGQRMLYRKGRKVEAGDVLADGRRFRDVDEFKQLLLKEKDQIARALAVKLLTYATGAAPGPADAGEVDNIVRKVRGKEYRFRTLVHEIIKSNLFQHK